MEYSMPIRVGEAPDELLPNHINRERIDACRRIDQVHRCERLILYEPEHGTGYEQGQDHALPVPPSALFVELWSLLDVLMSILYDPVDHKASDHGPCCEPQEHVCTKERPPDHVRRSLNVERQRKHSTEEPRLGFDIK